MSQACLKFQIFTGSKILIYGQGGLAAEASVLRHPGDSNLDQAFGIGVEAGPFLLAPIGQAESKRDAKIGCNGFPDLIWDGNLKEGSLRRGIERIAGESMEGGVSTLFRGQRILPEPRTFGLFDFKNKSLM